MTITRINPDEILQYRKECERANLTFGGHTEYIGIKKGCTVIAFTGWKEYKNKIVFKNGYIPPQHRGQGYWKSMIWAKFMIAIVKKKKVEAVCTPYSLKYFLELGAEVIKEHNNNTTKVIFTYDSLLKAERMARGFATHPLSI